MVERLRAEPEATGLVSGVGMHMTKHVFGVYRATPGPVAPPDADRVQAAVDARGPCRGGRGARRRRRRSRAYSVVHGRDGGPEWALLVCDLPGGRRTYAQARDGDLCADAETTEFVGRTVTLKPQTVDGPMGRARVNRASW